MLRSVAVAERHGLVEIAALDDEGVSDALADNVDAREGEGLLLDLRLNGRELRIVEGNSEQDHLRVGTVLGLTEQVRGNEGGIARRVGDDLRTQVTVSI